VSGEGRSLLFVDEAALDELLKLGFSFTDLVHGRIE
jgi:hypothetical protein